MRAPWRVTIGAGAERTFRELHPRDQAQVARALDDLAVAGASAAAPQGDGLHTLRAGRHELLLGVRTDPAEIVLVRIDEASEENAPLMNAVPLSASRRAALADLWSGWSMDLRYTLRSLRRSPVFTFVVVLTLALGVAGATATVGLVDTVYRGALPFENADQLFRIRNVSATTSGEVRRYNVSSRDVHVYRRESRVFTGIAAMSGYSLALVGTGTAERVSAIGVSPRWTEIMGLRPMLGRTFTPEEEAAGRDAGVALISASLWERRFGADSALDRLRLRHDGGVLHVVGVMPHGFAYPYDSDVWSTWTFDPNEWRNSGLNVVARLRPGVTAELAREDVERVHAVIRETARSTTSATGTEVAPIRADLIRDEARILKAITAAVLLLLVLTCVNVTNLLVARFVTRRGEMGVRAALGAGAGRQVRQLVTEVVALFLTGGAGGVLLAAWLSGLMRVLIPNELRTQVALPGNSLGMGMALSALGACLGLGALVGAVAALRAARADLAALVKEGSRRSSTGRDRRVFDALVVAQLGLSMVLLVGAGALIEHFRRLSGTDPGYDLRDVHTFRITLEQDRYAAGEARAALVRALEEQIAALPDVGDVGIVTVNPLCCGNWGAPIEVEGRPVAPEEAPALVHHSYVSPGYLRAMRIGLHGGEGFAPSDRPGMPLTVVVDEPMARALWPGEDPIGKRVRLARPGQEWRTVVGVARPVVKDGEFSAQWYLSYYQDPLGGSTNQLHIMVRVTAPGAIPSVQRTIRSIDPGLAVYGITTMEALQRERLAPDRLGAIISGLFAAFGLILAGFSLYGLLAYSVEARSHELGTRMALGASRRRILSLVLHQAAARLVVGLAAGSALALAMNQVLRGMVAGVEWVRPVTLALLVGVLIAAAAAAAVLPVRRAVRLDPVRAMRGV